jgi:hypothetical protein
VLSDIISHYAALRSSAGTVVTHSLIYLAHPLCHPGVTG